MSVDGLHNRLTIPSSLRLDGVANPLRQHVYCRRSCDSSSFDNTARRSGPESEKLPDLGSLTVHSRSCGFNTTQNVVQFPGRVGWENDARWETNASFVGGHLLRLSTGFKLALYTDKPQNARQHGAQDRRQEGTPFLPEYQLAIQTPPSQTRSLRCERPHHYQRQRQWSVSASSWGPIDRPGEHAGSGLGMPVSRFSDAGSGAPGASAEECDRPRTAEVDH